MAKKLILRDDGTREMKGLFLCPWCGKDKTTTNVDKKVSFCWPCWRGWPTSELPFFVYGAQVVVRKKTNLGDLKPLPQIATDTIRKRGHDPEWLETRYRVQWDGERMVWPAGRGWSRRALYSWEQPKTLTVAPRDLLGQHLLYEGCDVVLTEGDYKASSIPMPWIGVAVLGKVLTPAQADILCTFKPRTVTVLFDGGVHCDLPPAPLAYRVLTHLPPGQGPDDIPRRDLVQLLLQGVGS